MTEQDLRKTHVHIPSGPPGSADPSDFTYDLQAGFQQMLHAMWS